MTTRICKETGIPCEYQSACNQDWNPEGSCNKPIPIKDFAAQSPEHTEIVKDLLEKLKTGEISMCGCVGPGYGEPHCPCTMKRLGIPFSEERLKEEAASKIRFEELFEPGGYFYEKENPRCPQ